MKHLLAIALCIPLLAPAALAGPQRQVLDDLGPAEKANAVISIALGAAAAPHQSAVAGTIESLWNSGDFGPALELLDALEQQVDPDAIEVGIGWRIPLPAPAADWGTDVLVSAEDSVFAVSLVRDPGTGNLFAALSRMNGPSTRFLMLCFSDDGGASWSTTYSIAGSGRCPTTAMVMGDYCYLAYGRSSSLRLRRFFLPTGYSANLNNGSSYFDIITTTTDTIREIKLAELWDNDQLCCGTLHNDGTLRMFWTYDSGGVDWQQFTSPESIAERGLDVCGNYPYSGYLAFVSYYTSANQLRVLGLGAGAVWDTLVTGAVDSNAYFTAVGAYRDTVLVAFENRVSGTYRVQDIYSSNGGSSWSNGFLTPSDTNCYCPDLALQRGGGIGLAYAQGLPLSYRFSWWPYAGGGPSKSVVSVRAISASYRTAVEYLDGDVYGVAYISAASDLNRAYFDRSDWVAGVAGGPEQRISKHELRMEPNRPNPFKQWTMIDYQLPAAGTVSLKVYNIAGQLVRTLAGGFQPAGAHAVRWDGRDDRGREIAAGVYVCRLDAGGISTAGRLVHIR